MRRKQTTMLKHGKRKKERLDRIRDVNLIESGKSTGGTESKTSYARELVGKNPEKYIGKKGLDELLVESGVRHRKNLVRSFPIEIQKRMQWPVGRGLPPKKKKK